MRTPTPVEGSGATSARNRGFSLVEMMIAITVLAPGLFSTITCWPNDSASLAPISRPSASPPPPGANGTTSLMVWVG